MAPSAPATTAAAAATSCDGELRPVQLLCTLMDTVLDAIDERVADLADDSRPKEKMAKVGKFRRPIRRLNSLIAPTTSAGITLAYGAAGVTIPGEAIALVSEGAAALATSGRGGLVAA